MRFEHSAVVDGNAEEVFSLTQDYARRLTWDPFLRSAVLLNGALAPSVGVRAWCVSHGGIGMETEYVSFRPPHVVAVKMTRGPKMLESFAGTWEFDSMQEERTRVSFRYHLRARPRWLAWALEPVAKWWFSRETRLRILALQQQLTKTSKPAFTEPHEVLRILGDLECDWGVAGGWALDLFLDRITREHQDIEVAAFREDQLILQRYLSSRGWSLEYVRDGRLVPWPMGERLQLPVHEVWCRIGNGPLRRIEVLLNERAADTFVFRRDFRIRAPIDRTFVRSISGIRILAPEIVLLYKCKRPMQPKEQQDFSKTLAALDLERRQWLMQSLATLDPEHPWLAALRAL